MSLFNVTELGVITVDTSEISQDITTAYKTALGNDLNTDVGTAQGQLIQNDINNLVYVMDEVTAVSNSFSIYYAKGASLDTAAAYFGYYRKEGVKTVVSCILTGQQGTVVPAGALVGDGENEYRSLSTITIPASGTITGQFQCTREGAVTCLAGSVDSIITIIPGWDTAQNPTDGITGFMTESDNAFRSRITANWLNIRGKTVLGAIIDNVAQINGVLSVVGRENPANTAQEIDGITMKPHSIYLCVYGGSDEEIAEVLGTQKTVGADTNGSSVVSFYDETVNYIYNYNIQRADVINLSVQIEYSNNSFTPADVQSKITGTVMAWVAENMFKIGQTVSGNMLAESLAGFNFINLLSFKVKLSSEENFQDYVSLTLEQIGVLSENDISYVVI